MAFLVSLTDANMHVAEEVAETTPKLMMDRDGKNRFFTPYLSFPKSTLYFGSARVFECPSLNADHKGSH